METKNSFTDHVLEINEIASDNAPLRSLLMDVFYRNLPKHIQIQFKSLLHKFHFTPRIKTGWKCRHGTCVDESCYSHEISENAFLKHLSDDYSRVIVIKKDMQNNPAFFIEETIHKRNASNFPGYCSFHDADLFRDIENVEQKLTEYFINKQSLRTIRKRIFETELQIRIAAEFIESISDDITSSKEINQVADRIKNKINNLKKGLIRLDDVYSQIQEGIENEKFVISYNEIESKKTGYFFSTCLDLTNTEDEEPCVIFLYKLDFGKEPKALVCTLKNKTSSTIGKEISSDPSHIFVNSMYSEKENLIFSHNFINSLSSTVKGILYRDAELYEISQLERRIIYEELF